MCSSRGRTKSCLPPFPPALLHKARLEVANLRSRQEQLSADMNQPFNEFIGASPAMQKVYDTILKVAETDANVLILGENGTGKELVARSLHRNSARARSFYQRRHGRDQRIPL